MAHSGPFRDYCIAQDHPVQTPDTRHRRQSAQPPITGIMRFNRPKRLDRTFSSKQGERQHHTAKRHCNITVSVSPQNARAEADGGRGGRGRQWERRKKKQKRGPTASSPPPPKPARDLSVLGVAVALSFPFLSLPAIHDSRFIAPFRFAPQRPDCLPDSSSQQRVFVPSYPRSFVPPFPPYPRITPSQAARHPRYLGTSRVPLPSPTLPLPRRPRPTDHLNLTISSP